MTKIYIFLFFLIFSTQLNAADTYHYGGTYCANNNSCPSSNYDEGCSGPGGGGLCNCTNQFTIGKRKIYQYYPGNCGGAGRFDDGIVYNADEFGVPVGWVVTIDSVRYLTVYAPADSTLPQFGSTPNIGLQPLDDNVSLSALPSANQDAGDCLTASACAEKAYQELQDSGADLVCDPCTISYSDPNNYSFTDSNGNVSIKGTGSESTPVNHQPSGGGSSGTGSGTSSGGTGSGTGEPVGGDLGGGSGTNPNPDTGADPNNGDDTGTGTDPNDGTGGTGTGTDPNDGTGTGGTGTGTDPNSGIDPDLGTDTGTGGGSPVCSTPPDCGTSLADAVNDLLDDAPPFQGNELGCFPNCGLTEEFDDYLEPESSTDELSSLQSIQQSSKNSELILDNIDKNLVTSLNSIQSNQAQANTNDNARTQALIDELNLVRQNQQLRDDNDNLRTESLLNKLSDIENAINNTESENLSDGSEEVGFNQAVDNLNNAYSGIDDLINSDLSDHQTFNNTIAGNVEGSVLNLIPDISACSHIQFTPIDGIDFSLSCEDSQRFRDFIGWVLYLFTAYYLFDVLVSSRRVA